MPHTPGPWLLADRAFVYALCESKTHNRFDAIIQRGFTDTGKTTDEELFANARLIAAAPDLLVACDAAESMLDSLVIDEATRKAGLWQGDGPKRALALLHAAIAKVRGTI